jgi:tetratricopeptide (TPR) repeat protein
MVGLGRALAAQGKLVEATARFREVVRLCPTNAEAHLNLGNTLTDSGQTNDAAACFATALRLEPRLAEKNLQAGKTLAGQGKFDAAFVHFTQAARLQPENADPREQLGMLYAQQGKLDQAVTEFREQLRLRPDAQAWYNLGLARVMQGNLGEAVTNYEQAVKLDPNRAVALNDLAWIRATAPQADLRNGAEAVQLAEQACKLSGGKEAQFLGTLDAAYAEAGRWAEAITTAEKTRELAAAAGQKDIAKAAAERLALYQSKQPYHQPAPPTAGH